MPIAPKYTWSETAADVTVVFEGVSLRASAPASSANGGLSLGGAGVGDPLVVSDRVVKLNLPPHFALLDLHGEVDDSKAVASFAVVEAAGEEEEQEQEEGEGGAERAGAGAAAKSATTPTAITKPLSRRPILTLRLPKRHPGEHWGRLLAHAPPGTEEARQVAARRALSLERWRARRQAEAEQRAERRRAAESQAADRALLLEERRREVAEAKRGKVLEEARAAVAEWGAAMAVATAGGGEGGAEPKRDANGRGRGKHQPDQDPADDKDEDDNESDYDEDLEGLVAAGGAEEDGGGEGGGAKPPPPPRPARSPPPAAADSEWYHGRCRWRSKEKINEDEEDNDEKVGKEAAATEAPPPPPPPPPMPPLSPLAVPVDAPPVRGSQAAGGLVFRVSFTETACGSMPLREGREAELVAAAMRRQKEEKAKKKDEAAMGALPPPPLDERSPAFLKDKGDALFRRADSDGAAHAYTRALEAGGADDPALAAALLSNRAAALLRLAEGGGGEDAARRCVADCDAAIAELDKDENKGGPSLLLARARALARRGAARALLLPGASATAAAAANDCAEAARLFARAGDPGRAKALEAEAERLRGLSAGSV